MLLSDVKNTHNSHNTQLVISSWVVLLSFGAGWLFFQVSEFDASQVSRLDVQRFGDLTKPWHHFNVGETEDLRFSFYLAFLLGDGGYYVCSTANSFKNVDVSNLKNEENGYQQDIQQIWIQLELNRQHHWLFGWKCYSHWNVPRMCQDSWKSVNLRIRNACSSVHMRKWWMLWLSC